MNINSDTFVQDFKISDAVVGQVGYGFIGNAVVELFRPHVAEVVVYDLVKSQQGPYSVHHNVIVCRSLEEVVASSDLIFVAVPTPMKPSGECHTGIVESVLQDIQNTAIKIGRGLDEFVVVLKSTVPPGFTRKMQDRYALRLIFSPEFLTEANAVRDFQTANRVILGGEHDDALVAFKFFEGVWPDRQPNTFIDHKDGPVHIIQCDTEVAEMVKLSTNVHLTARVMISNELYLICQKLGVSYDDVKVLTQLDRRIGLSHMNVPGPDGELGFSGSCFPKDINNLGFISRSFGFADNLFDSIQKRNEAVRGNKDWETLVGRAIISSDEK